jgi:hypothetical protein
VLVELSVLQQFTRKLLKHVPVRVDDAMCLTYHFAHHRNAMGARLGDGIEHRHPLLAIVTAPDAVILIRTIPTYTPLRDLGARLRCRYITACPRRTSSPILQDLVFGTQPH